jgi:UDP-2,3-diacylglucosamine hydrolase
MRLLVISDLHVWGSDDPLYRSLLALIRDRAREGDTLVLAGDVFDLFLGNKHVYVNRYSEFFAELKRAGERGVRIHYIEGNHDFLLRKAFRDIPGCQVHPHDVRLELAGKRFFVAHGDTVDRTDYGYRALRLLFRSPLMRAFLTLAPGRVVEAFGETSARKSREAKPRLVKDLPVARLEQLRKHYRSFAAERLSEGYDFVVLGHCHDLDEMRFQIGGRSGQYVNVGYPRAHGSFLSWSPDEAEIAREPLP